MFNYLEKEIGVNIIRNPVIIELKGKTIMIGHGDGLGPGDLNYKFIKKSLQVKYVSGFMQDYTPILVFSLLTGHKK